jgi:ABC-2 type transport system ATP-binding protein
LSSLSGGQQQRVNLIITILRRPSLLILDEVATGLDAEVYGKVIDFIENYTSNPDVTLILISHKYSEIKKLTDRTILVKDGIISKSLATKTLTKVKFEDFTHEDLISSKETIDREMFKD